MKLTKEGQTIQKPEDILKNPLSLEFLGLEEKTSYSETDLGQMQMYVNYYDRFVKLDYEKPTIGILLCKKKTDALVKLTLPKDAKIYASEYSLYLPDKLLLKQKLTEWVNEFENEVKDEE